MKLFDNGFAPNTRRVRMFLAEKGIEVDRQEIDLGKGEHKTPEYIAQVPSGKVPALLLDDGTVIEESVAICRYFEALQPEPNLMGADPKEQALIEMWSRKTEFEVFLTMAMCFRHTHKFAKGLERQCFPEFGEYQRAFALEGLARLDQHLATHDFIAADRFSIADITVFCGLEFFKLADFGIAGDQANLQRWYDSVKARPSAAA